MNASRHTGFATPVFDSQRAFRVIMDAMARPGSLQHMPIDLTPPDGVPLAAAATVLALCDFETALWVSPDIQNAREIEDYCVFQTGCTRAKTARQAHFAIVNLAVSQLRLNDFNHGTANYPDTSTTLIVNVPALTGGRPHTLSGPGINGTAGFDVSGLPGDFADQSALNRATFPLGVDIIFCAGSHILALPRSTKIKAH